jgi:hypothetical protein
VRGGAIAYRRGEETEVWGGVEKWCVECVCRLGVIRVWLAKGARDAPHMAANVRAVVGTSQTERERGQGRHAHGRWRGNSRRGG